MSATGGGEIQTSQKPTAESKPRARKLDEQETVKTAVNLIEGAGSALAAGENAVAQQTIAEFAKKYILLERPAEEIAAQTTTTGAAKTSEKTGSKEDEHDKTHDDKTKTDKKDGDKPNEKKPFFTKEKLKEVVENKWTKRVTNTALILSSISPTARVAIEGTNITLNQLANEKYAEATKTFLQYGLRTGLSYGTMGGSELVNALWRTLIPKNPFKGEQWKEKYSKTGFKTLGMGVGAGVITLALAPTIASGIVSASEGLGAAQRLAEYGANTNIFRPELAKAYINVASKMGLATLTGYIGKKAFKEEYSEGFEMARRATTGLFALEAFGQHLYNDQGNALTGNRTIPLTDWRPHNILTDAGEKISPVMDTTGRFIDNIIHPGNIQREPHQDTLPDDSDKPIEQFLQGANGQEYTINPDGTVQFSHHDPAYHDPLPPAREQLGAFVHPQGESNEPIAQAETHTVPAKNYVGDMGTGDINLDPRHGTAQFADYRTENNGQLHLVKGLEVPAQGQTEGDVDPSFDKFIPDSHDVKNLETFIHNPQTKMSDEWLLHQTTVTKADENTLVLGQIKPELVQLQLHQGQGSEIVHQAETIVNDIGKELEARGASGEYTVHFKYGNTNVDIPVNLDSLMNKVANGTNLGEHIVEQADEILAREANFFETNDHRNDPDFQTSYKVAILEQFAHSLGVDDIDEVITNNHGNHIQKFAVNNKISFYEELAARIYDRDPQEAQSLFETRFNPDVTPPKFLADLTGEMVTAGRERIEMALNQQAAEIPKAEFSVMHDLAVDKDHGFLERSNSYLGEKAMTVNIQLSDGTMLGFGSEAHKEDLVPGQTHYIHDDGGIKGIEDELRAEIHKINPTISEDQVDRLVVEASIRLAEVAETHNYGRYLETILKDNPDTVITIKADGEDIIKSFQLEYDSATQHFNIYDSNNNLLGDVTASGLQGGDLLIEKLSNSYQFFSHNLQNIALHPNAADYQTNLNALENGIIDSFEDIQRDFPSRTLYADQYYAVNGDPHAFRYSGSFEPEKGTAILGYITGDHLMRELGHIEPINSEIITRPEVTETTDFTYDKGYLAGEVAKSADIGNIQFYNHGQLLVLNQLQENVIQNASRELAQYHFENAGVATGDPVVLTLPLTQAGYTSNFNIQLNGGPVDMGVIYTEVAAHLNQNQDTGWFSSGVIANPQDLGFQTYVDHLILKGLMPEMQERGISIDRIIDTNNVYFGIGSEERLTIPVSEIVNSSHVNLPEELIRLSMQRVVGIPESLSADGVPTLSRLAVSPAAVNLQTAPSNPVDPTQPIPTLPPATAPVIPTILSSIGDGMQSLWAGFGNAMQGTRENLVNTFLYIVGSPAAARTIQGTSDFANAVVVDGTPYAWHAARVAASYPAEAVIDAGDIAYTTKTNLDRVEILGFHPFTIADHMLARPLQSLGEFSYVNRNHIDYAGYGLDKVLINLGDDFDMRNLEGGYGNRGVTNPNALPDSIDDWWNVPGRIFDNLNSYQYNEPERIVNAPHWGNWGAYDTYTVQSGDSLSEIAGRLWGRQDLWPYLYEANKDIIENPRVIFRGEILRIPNINN